MTEVAARLHGPDLPAAGVPAHVSVRGDFLRVWRAEGAEDVSLGAIHVDVTGFHEDTLLLSWQRQGATYAVSLADPAATRALLAEAPADFAPRVKRGQATVQYHRTKWRVLLGLLVGLVGAVIVAWWQKDAIVRAIAERISLETEIRIGEQGLAQIEREHTLTQEGLAAQAVAQIGARLTQGSRYQYRWYISNHAEVNAFALPGGIVVVNRGLLREAASAEELAGVLAHEVQHVEGRHTLQQMVSSAGWAAVLAVVLGDVSGVTAVLLHQLGNMRNSRALEQQADEEGMKALARAGIPLGGMVSLFKRLQAVQEKRGGELPEMFSSHPATAERIARLEALARQLACDCQPLGIDWAAVQAESAVP